MRSSEWEGQRQSEQRTAKNEQPQSASGNAPDRDSVTNSEVRLSSSDFGLACRGDEAHGSHGEAEWSPHHPRMRGPRTEIAETATAFWMKWAVAQGMMLPRHSRIMAKTRPSAPTTTIWRRA